jgi:predicted dienelactone hydrolase
MAAAENVGFQIVHAPDPPGPDLAVGIWYPTTAEPVESDLELLTQLVAPGAPIAGCCHKLVIMSHGNGASLASHDDTALALAHAGFVVAAMTHTADNWRDHSRELHMEDRTRQVKAALDFLLSSWHGHTAIDPARIGMFGFSAGGFTTLVSIGGVPDLNRVRPYCADHAATFTCELTRSHTEKLEPPPPAAWIAEPRIKAAVIAAPAVGFSFLPNGLRNVKVPIQLWAAAGDHILPVADNAEAVRDALPQKPEYHSVPSADHFDFLTPCSDALAQTAPMICAEPPGFDRLAFHASFNDAVIAFFNRTLE